MCVSQQLSLTMQWIDLDFGLIPVINRKEARPRRSYIFAVPWATTIAPLGCSVVSVMSMRIWVKFFLILCVSPTAAQW